MTVETPEIAPDQKPRAARITQIVIDAISQMVSEEMLTEAEACHQIGINPQQWYSYKNRGKHSARFESTCTRIRGASISHAMKRIKRAGDKDWRADIARLGVIDRNRFGARTEHTGEVKHTHQLSDDSKRKIEAMLKASLQQPVIDCQVVDTKQITSE